MEPSLRLDTSNLVKIEITKDEVHLLGRLLRFELFYIIRYFIEAKSTMEEKLLKIVGCMDTYNLADNSLSTLYQEFQPGEDLLAAMFDKRIMKLFRVLCTETVKMGLTEEIKKKFDDIGHKMLEKISLAINDHNPELPGNIKVNVPVMGLA